MTKIIISIVSVLLILFPFSGTLRSVYQNMTFPGRDVIISDIIDAVKSEDIEALEKMFSDNKKEEIENLSEKLQTMIELIDGEIINAEFLAGLGGESSESGMGYAVHSYSWEIEFETSKSSYILLVSWVKTDTLEPENVGLVSFKLLDTENKDDQGFYTELILIK